MSDKDKKSPLPFSMGGEKTLFQAEILHCEENIKMLLFIEVYARSQLTSSSGLSHE